MKKFFLIPFMTLFTCVMAWGADAHVSTIADLNAKLADASVETIYLDADLTYAGEACVNILRSVTIDGQGHKISGQGVRTGSTYSSLAINQGAPSNNNWIDSVALKNLTIENTRSAGQALNVRCNLSALLIDNCEIITTNAGGNSQPITIGGNQSTPVRFYVYDSKVTANTSGYPVITFNPIALETKNTTYTGYCGLYFKGVSSSAGSRGSVVYADACNFECPNVHSGVSNAFSCFPIADDGITLNLHNCGINNQQIGDQNQALVTIGNDSRSDRCEQPININISGDNSHINVGGGINKTFQNLWIWGPGYVQNNDFADINITITGGTYSSNPMVSEEEENYDMAAYGHWVVEDEQLTWNVDIIAPTIPEGYEVKAVTTQQGDQTTTLYRVRKTITTAYSINDNVENQGDGQNENTEFIISANESVEQGSTVANYVEVGNDATLTVGEGKTLEVTNGLDVAAGSQVVVEPGATLVVGEGGVITGDAEGIVIETEDDKPASFLLNPDVIVNTTPNLTVKMIANAGYDGEDWYWHRFAMPVNGITSWTKQDAEGNAINVPTYLQGWDYTENEWASRTVDQMVPFLGYTLTYDEVGGSPTTGETEVTYIFKGNLVGNLNKDLLFQAKGYNFFGNSYTAYIDAKTLLADVMNDPTIGGAVYMWNANNQDYEAVTMRDLRDHADLLDSFMKEIAPMQTFILQLRSSDIPTVSVDYRSTIWGNPRYNKVAASAPARQMASNDNYVKITLTAENGKTDAVRLTENAEFSAAYDNGADADKYMNSNHFNFYATVAGQDYSNVATDNIEGTMLSLKSQKGVRYTMSFSNVEGNVYAIKDMLTGVVTEMSEGNTYEFTAPEDAVSANRFMIVGRQDAPTAIEDAEMTTSAQKGIYTIMGQYLGETNIFNTLPAGVYVVDGVKVIR